MKRLGAWCAGAIGILLAILGVSRSVDLVSRTGAIDLRNRVAAARQAERGIDPYRYKWKPGDSDTLVDARDDPRARFTRLTSPPSTVWVHSLFARLPYRGQKWANAFLAWLTLIAIAWWMAVSLGVRVPAVLLATGAYAVSGPWQLHVERGQQYAYFALLLLLAVSPPHPASGPLFRALAGVFRPTLWVSVFTAFRERRVLRSVLLTVGAGGLAALPVLVAYPASWWFDYLASARYWYYDLFDPNGLNRAARSVAAFAYPIAPEGDPAMTAAWAFRTSGNGLLHYAVKLGVMPSFELITAATLGLGVVAGIVLWRGRREAPASFAARFFGAVYLIDFITPAPRGAYNAVLFFPAIVLAVGELLRSGPIGPERGRFDWEWTWAAIVSAGLALSLVSVVRPGASPVPFESFMVLGAIVALFRPVMRSSGRDASALPRAASEPEL